MLHDMSGGFQYDLCVESTANGLSGVWSFAKSQWERRRMNIKHGTCMEDHMPIHMADCECVLQLLLVYAHPVICYSLIVQHVVSMQQVC